jgi:hypothetical protein
VNKVIFLIFGLIFLAGCVSETQSISIRYDDLKQCESTPWGGFYEQDIQDFYLENYNIELIDVKMVIMEIAVCAACGCPLPIYFTANVSEKDIQNMIELGWKYN